MQGPHLTKLLVFSESVASSVTVVHHSLTREEVEGEGTVKMDTLRAACQSIWQHCALPLVSRATEPLPSPHLATTAASLTVFACEWYRNVNKSNGKQCNERVFLFTIAVPHC